PDLEKIEYLRADRGVLVWFFGRWHGGSSCTLKTAASDLGKLGEGGFSSDSPLPAKLLRRHLVSFPLTEAPRASGCLLQDRLHLGAGEGPHCLGADVAQHVGRQQHARSRLVVRRLEHAHLII